jgi:hypothetical protein
LVEHFGDGLGAAAPELAQTVHAVALFQEFYEAADLGIDDAGRIHGSVPVGVDHPLEGQGLIAGY